MTIVVYISSVTIKKEVSAHQNHIETVLKAKKVPYTFIDIATNVGKKEEMRELCGNQTAVAPQIFHDNVYLGDYAAFQEAVEEETLMTFLKVQQ